MTERGRLHERQACIADRDRVGPPAGRVVFGLLVIAFGVLLTLDSLGMATAGDVLHWWPAALVVYGVARLMGFCCRQNTVIGILAALAGAALLLHHTGLMRTDPWDLWPVVLIVVGGSMVNRAMRHASGCVDARGPGAPAPGEPVAGGPGSFTRQAGEPAAAAAAMPDDSPSRLSSFALLSKVERKVVSQNVRGGDVAAIMGAQSLDLRGAGLAGGTATIDLVVVWGSVDLLVPADWKVSVETLTLLGGFEDATRVPTGEVRGHLILRGVVFMGGVEARN